ncbi:thioredoxin domain-containing protein [Novosphingobium flavum]|uniref:Thioredoxin domain-containing protein n=1 Tax=Novosphingobium aerophilum TaxID=2839843 RepID=A0A7X1FAC7_9SPHN|nr:thioredoxin domain-containing protein [Novosphingobium aerophilum]MBC2653338.1 thioredoxin domain-containing protein [Novosphingobium aerophilum]MBC2663592.1 thioredoxin domain-containing protein [Novosphingobium aerophilum]
MSVIPAQNRSPSRGRALIVAALLAPIALGLAGCKKDAAADGAAPSAASTPLPTVAAPAGKTWADTVAATPEGGYRMGNPDAAIKIVEYGSLTCPHCAEFSEKGSATIRDQWVSSGRVSYEFRHFVRDGLDLTMGLLTRCGGPETYLPLTEQVFANQRTLFDSLKGRDAQLNAAMSAPPGQRFGAISDAAGLGEFFAARGIAVDQAKACLAKTDVAEQMAKQTTEQGEKLAIEGTPTFLINGEKIGTVTWEEFKTRIEAMGVR